MSKSISIKEAIFALDYIDHDFYVFRDDESNEVSVVYKRNAGGVGLIQPEQYAKQRKQSTQHCVLNTQSKQLGCLFESRKLGAECGRCGVVFLRIAGFTGRRRKYGQL